MWVGVWAKELINSGYTAFGIDISADMIKLARQKVPKCSFKVGSFLNMKLPACDVITSFGECFNYLFDKKNNKSELNILFKKIWNALSPKGIFIFDIAEPGRGIGPRQKHSEGNDWSVLVDIEENQNILTRHITTFRRINKLYRRSEEIHTLKLYKGSEIAKELRKIGFKVRLIRGYGNWQYPKSWVGVIAYKF